MKFKISRRAVIFGVIFGISAILIGIIVIDYTDIFILVVMLWPVLLIMIFQTAKWFMKIMKRRK